MEFYRGFNVSWTEVDKYFESPSSINRDWLKPCVETRLMISEAGLEISRRFNQPRKAKGDIPNAVMFGCESYPPKAVYCWHPWHFICKFLQKFLLCMQSFRPRRLAQSVVPGLGPRHFTGKFSRKVALAKCPSACRLQRLAQWSPVVARGILPVNSRTKWLL